ncbi:hypothetical protein ABZW47_29405 [Streptomyces sp. NPDC004549]|uniref:hypothetical protein n=1 Tax=Streptomyces sp. NPDC004549 TaxID=3154283 RepID=UPI0033BEA7D6
MVIRKWTFTEVESVLEERYGLVGMRISIPALPPPRDDRLAECGRWDVQAADGGPVFHLVQYDVSSVDAVKQVWHMAAYLRVLPMVYSVTALPDCDGALVALGRDGMPCVLFEAPQGCIVEDTVFATAGVILAKVHRALAAYPKPARREMAWQEATAAEVIAAHERAATPTPPPSPQLQELLRTLSWWIEAGLSSLRDGLTALLEPGQEQALHGAFLPTRLYWGVTLSGLGPPDPCTGLPLWELARLAFPPQNLIGNPGWLRQGTGLLTAYQRTHPAGLSPAALASTLRLTALDLLCRPLPPDPRAWVQRHKALCTLLSALPTTEVSLRAALTCLS